MKKDIEPIIKKIKERMLNLIKDQNYIEELFSVYDIMQNYILKKFSLVLKNMLMKLI